MAKAKKVQEPKQEFDPSQNYQVKPEAEFKIRGEELVLLGNFAKSILVKPESKEVLQAMDTFQITQRLLKEGVEAGNVISAEKEPTVEPKVLPMKPAK